MRSQRGNLHRGGNTNNKGTSQPPPRSVIANTTINTKRHPERLALPPRWSRTSAPLNHNINNNKEEAATTTTTTTSPGRGSLARPGDEDGPNTFGDLVTFKIPGGPTF